MKVTVRPRKYPDRIVWTAHLLLAGKDLRAVQALMGHRNKPESRQR